MTYQRRHAETLESIMTTMNETPAPDVAPAKGGMSKGSLVGLIAASLVVGAVLLATTGGGGSGSNGPSSEDMRLDSQRVCQDFVKQNLKAPSTAKFSDVTASADAEDWIVQGSVDSENSFGAMLRNQFTCDLSYDAAANLWKLSALTGLN